MRFQDLELTGLLIKYYSWNRSLDNAVTGGFEVKKISKKRSAVDKNAWSG